MNRRKKNRAKDAECYQLCFMLYLMAGHQRTVLIQRVERRSKQTEQSFRVAEVRGDQVVAFRKEVEARAEQAIKQTTNEKQRKRYFLKNCVAVGFNRMVELLEALGYIFEFSRSRTSEQTVKMNRFKSVHRLDQEFSKQTVFDIGRRTATLLNQEFDQTDDKVLVIDSSLRLRLGAPPEEPAPPPLHAVPSPRTAFTRVVTINTLPESTNPVFSYPVSPPDPTPHPPSDEPLFRPF